MGGQNTKVSGGGDSKIFGWGQLCRLLCLDELQQINIGCKSVKEASETSPRFQSEKLEVDFIWEALLQSTSNIRP